MDKLKENVFWINDCKIDDGFCMTHGYPVNAKAPCPRSSLTDEEWEKIYVKSILSKELRNPRIIDQEVLKEFEKTVSWLQRLNEMTRREKRKEKLKEKEGARKQATKIGVKVCFSEDPKGSPLYFIEEEGQDYWQGLFSWGDK